MNQGYAFQEEVGQRARGLTVLAYLAERYRHSTREEWQARIAAGEVTVNGRSAEADRLLRAGESLCWHRPPWEEEPTPQTFRVVHEDADVLAVDKPSGLPTLPGAGFLEHTLLTLVQRQVPGAIPVHRLGRGTSGLVLFAKTRQAAAELSRSWRAHQVEKRYRALGEGLAAEPCYEIRAPIGLVPHPRLGSVHAAREDGKPSHSTARVLERRPAATLFAVDIHTGRPDQIRIHLAFIGHPLVGDRFYVAGGTPCVTSPGLPGEGGYLLHGERLAFHHPVSRQPLVLHVPPPPSLEAGSGRVDGILERS